MDGWTKLATRLAKSSIVSKTSCPPKGSAKPAGIVEDGVVLIDVESRKAFHSIDIDFLSDACRRFDLGENCCRWIRLFYSGSSAK